MEYIPIPVIKLTATKLKESIWSTDNFDIQEFISKQNFSKNQKDIIEKLFIEAKENNFLVNIEKAE